MTPCGDSELPALLGLHLSHWLVLNRVNALQILPFCSSWRFHRSDAITRDGSDRNDTILKTIRGSTFYIASTPSVTVKEISPVLITVPENALVTAWTINEQ